MRLFTKSLSAGVKCCFRTSLLASLFFLSFNLHANAVGTASAPAIVNDQYKFTQLTFTPFVYDQFSGFDYTGYQVHRVYVHTVNETDYVKRIFGNAEHTLGIHAPPAYNNNFCTGPTSGGAPPTGFLSVVTMHMNSIHGLASASPIGRTNSLVKKMWLSIQRR